MKKGKEFLSMDWFKERVEKAVNKAIDKRIDVIVEAKSIPSQERPYLNVMLVNEVLTVVLRDGSILTKPNATEKDYLTVQKAKSIEVINAVIEDEEIVHEQIETKAEATRLTGVVEGLERLKLIKDFVFDGKTACLRGTSRSIPPLLLDKFATVVSKHFNQIKVKGLGTIDTVDIGKLNEALANDDEYQGLKNFFMWCCLNPRAEVADSLYGFLDRNGMKITKQGFFVALRNVVEVRDAGNSNVIKYISNAYNKVKAVWKKNPADYLIIAHPDDSFSLVEILDLDKTKEGSIVGNLTQLYLDLPNMTQNRFTDNWTKTFDIRIGKVVSMPKEKCDWSTQDCARAGLHFAGHTAPYVLCGDTSVFTLHNPMKVVGIGSEKGRCWEYLPFMTTTVSEANQIMNSRDFDFFQLDEQYAITELEDLAKRVKDGFTAESTKYEFNLPSISTAEINSIVLSLGEMKKTITKRVSVLD